MTLQRSCKIIHFSFFLYSQRSQSPRFFQPLALPHTQAIVTVFIEPASSIQTICMHRCFIKGSFQQQRRRRRWRGRWRRKEKLALLWFGYEFSFYFPYWFTVRERWHIWARRCREKRREENSEQGCISNEGEKTSPLAASISPSLQFCKTYQWINDLALRI